MVEFFVNYFIFLIIKIYFLYSNLEEYSGKYGLVCDFEKVPEQVVVECNN